MVPRGRGHHPPRAPGVPGRYRRARHYAFTLLTTADALEADDRWKYARTDEERRNTAMRYIIGFGRIV